MRVAVLCPQTREADDLGGDDIEHLRYPRHETLAVIVEYTLR